MAETGRRPLPSAPAARSLRQQLILWLSVAGASLGALALVDTRAEALRTAQSVSDRVLAGSAMAIAEQITLSEEGGVDVMVPYSALEMLSSPAQDLVFYRIDGPEGFVTGYPDLPRVEPAGAEPAYRDIDYGETPLRAAGLRRLLSDEAGTQVFFVTVAESVRARIELGQSILLRSALRLTLLMAALGSIAWLVVTLALRPLDRLGAAISRRDASDLMSIDAEVPREVAPLVQAINLFMGRLGDAMEAMRRFTANANHQVRTPLTTARTHLALAARAGAEASGSLEKADAALIRTERVLEQLLLLARVDASVQRTPLVTTDLAALAREIAAEAIPTAGERRQDLGYEGEAVALVEAEPVLLSEAIRNLVDNAIVHNPPGTIITVRVIAVAGGIELSVSDDGTGFAAAPVDLALEPPAASTRQAPPPRPTLAHGLGLSIVREIAALNRAGFRIARGPEGRGSVVVLRFAGRAAA